MDKAVFGDNARFGYFRFGCYRDDWDKLVKKFEGVGSCDVTRRRLMVNHEKDTTTGWFTTSYEESTIETVFFPQSSTRLAVGAGFYVRSDALLATADVLVEGDEVKTDNGDYYEVHGERPHRVGDCFLYRDVDLRLLPFHEVGSAGEPAVTVNDARKNTKTYLETYVDNLNPARYMITYDMPNYPITRVFIDRSIDIVFSIGDPNSTPLMGHDRAPYGYEENVPITIFCIDKYDIVGAKLKWAAEAELRRVCETYPSGSQRGLERRRNNDQVLGSTMLYSTEYVLNYRRDLT